MEDNQNENKINNQEESLKTIVNVGILEFIIQK